MHLDPGIRRGERRKTSGHPDNQGVDLGLSLEQGAVNAYPCSMSTFPKSAKIAAIVGAIAATAVGAWLVLAPGNPPAPVNTPAPVAPEAVPATGAPTEPAKTIILSLLPSPDPEQACSADGAWCVSLTPPDDEGLRRPVIRPGANTGPSAAPAEPTDAVETYAVWPTLIALADGGFIAGVETRMSTGYSGGGGSATELRLFKVSGGQTSPAPILNLPVKGDLLIRACFSEADVEKRGEACHDEYGFTGKLEIETANGAMPALAYSTNAWAFPRGASRDEDSTTRGPLTAADLVRETDRTCSFSRRFLFNARTGVYTPDRTLPDCSNYTTP